MDIKKYAKKYAENGFKVFELTENTKVPLKNSGGLKDATNDPVLIDLFNPVHNLAIATGKWSNLFVLDIDEKSEGPKSINRLRQQYGQIPDTLRVKTPGGYHLYFSWPDEEITNSTSKVAPGLDIRGEGGYVVAPPSEINGVRYKFENKSDVLEAPEWLIALAISKPKQQAHGQDIPNIIRNGTRDDTLTSLAGTYRKRGMNEEEIYQHLTVDNQRCETPLTDNQLRKIAKSVSRYERGEYPDKIKRPNDNIKIIGCNELLDYTVEKTNRYIEPVLSFKNFIPNFASDEVFGDIEIGDIVGIMGPAGTGKTDFMLNMIRTNPQTGIIVISIDQPMHKIAYRMTQMIYSLTKTESREYFKGQIKREDFKRFMNMNIVDGSHSLRQIDERIAEFEQRNEIEVKAIFLDFLQKINQKGSGPERVSTIVAGLGGLRDKTGCAVLPLIQPNRESNTGGTLNKFSGSGSGEIENSCDLMIGLVRPDERKEEMIVKTLKTREASEGKWEKIIHKYPSRIMAPVDKRHVDTTVSERMVGEYEEDVPF